MGESRRHDGLRIVFGPSLDRSAWPGAVGQGGAAVDDAWLGPRGLLDRLETELGLGRLWPRRSERASALSRACAGLDGFWSRSHDADALGTAQRLLADRDALCMWGWRGEPVSPRLAQLADVTASIPPGIPDRLEAVRAELARHRPEIAVIELTSPEQHLPPLWRDVLASLRAAGIRVVEAPPRPVAATGDLDAARAADFAPRGDGSLTLFRPHGLLAAAEEVAGALAARDTLEDVLVIGADRVLADAFTRAGLPRPAVPGAVPESVAAVRLIVELVFHPADPMLLYKLLCLDPGPVPRGIARRLVRAVAELPARGSPPFLAALERGIESIAEERRERVRRRITGLILPVADRDEPVAIETVADRMRLLATWAGGVAENEPSVGAVVAAAEHVARLLQAMDATHLRRVELRRLVDEIDDIASTASPGQAGAHTVDQPGAVLGPSPVILWWGFTRDRAHAPRRVWLSEAERAALRGAGITPPDPATLTAAAAREWRRPLEQASEALVLVCPRRVEANEKGFPHPLWDELSAAMAGSAAAAALVTPTLSVPTAPARSRVTLRSRPSPRATWQAGHPIPLRERGESPSGLESLISCSLQWALRYHGRLGARFSPPAAPGPLLYGTVAHVVLARVFENGALAPEVAEAEARAILDRELAQLCETVFLPRYQVERATLTQAVVGSAAELARRIALMGAAIRGVEHPLERTLPELAMRGIADLVLDDPESVIDLKWSKTWNRRKLEAGTALQLAAYAELARTGASRPQVGYFILKSQELLAEPGTVFPEAAVPGEHRAVEIWRGAMTALEVARAELARGRLHSPGAVTEEIDEGLADDGLVLAPTCKFCAYPALCGRGGGT